MSSPALRKQRARQWLHDYKAHCACSVCGETHIGCIEFHHLDEATKQDNISHLLRNSGSIERLQSELSKCIPLCSNCHRKLHHGVTLWNIHQAYHEPNGRLVSLSGVVNGRTIL